MSTMGRSLERTRQSGSSTRANVVGGFGPRPNLSTVHVQVDDCCDYDGAYPTTRRLVASTSIGGLRATALSGASRGAYSDAAVRPAPRTLHVDVGRCRRLVK